MSKITQAGEFTVDKFEILTSTGIAQLDFEKNVTALDLAESVFSNTVFATIIVTDVNNLISNMHFVGQEYVTLKLSTPSLDSPIIDKVFSVVSVTGREDISVGAQVYVLNCVSPELLRSNRTRVTQSYTDTNSNIIKEILKDPSLLQSHKKFVVEKTQGIRKHIATNMRPLEFIRNLTRESISASNSGSPHFLFYENLDGFNFVTLDSLYNQDATASFEVGEVLAIDAEVKKDYEEDFSRLLDYLPSNTIDMLKGSRSGMFGSNLIKYNIFEKRYEVTDYKYLRDFNQFSRIREKPKYNNTDVELDKTDARRHLHPTSNSEGTDIRYDDASYVDNQCEQWILSRRSRMLELTMGDTHVVSIHGRAGLTIGDKVHMTIPITGKSHGGSEEDPNTGDFLITQIKHSFTQEPTRKHMMTMTVNTDGSSREFVNVAKGTEPTVSSFQVKEI